MRYRYSDEKRKKTTLLISEEALDLFSKFNDNKYDSLSDFVETNLFEQFDTPESFEITLDRLQREINRLKILKDERLKQLELKLELKKAQEAKKREEDRWRNPMIPAGARIVKTIEG